MPTEPIVAIQSSETNLNSPDGNFKVTIPFSEAIIRAYAPALRESVQYISWDDFFAVAINGRDSTQGAQVGNVMPAFGDNPNVAGHLEDIYRYLKAMGDGALQHPPPKRPKKLEMKDWPQHAKTVFEENKKKK